MGSLTAADTWRLHWEAKFAATGSDLPDDWAARWEQPGHELGLVVELVDQSPGSMTVRAGSGLVAYPGVTLTFSADPADLEQDELAMLAARYAGRIVRRLERKQRRHRLLRRPVARVGRRVFRARRVRSRRSRARSPGRPGDEPPDVDLGTAATP
jgi:hypothetical protein